MEEENLQKIENGAKNKNVIIAIILSVIVLLVGIVVYFVFIKEGRPVNNDEGNKQVVDNGKIWKNGKVKISDKEITLPCSVSDFENIFTVIIIKEEFQKWTSIDGHKIKFLLNKDESMIVGIMDGTRLSFEPKYSSSIVHFPGDIQLGDNITKVKDIYTSSELNTATKNRYNYTDLKEWQIVFYTDDNGVIEEINYFFLKLEV